MSYTPSSQGPFIVGILTTTTSVGTTETTVNYDEFRTSRGLLSSTPTLSGLAFSDVSASIGTGIVAFGEHCPKTGGGYGSDMVRYRGKRGASGAIGCAVYSSDTFAFRYAGYDTNDLIYSSHGYVL